MNEGLWNKMLKVKWFVIMLEFVKHFSSIESETGYYQMVVNRIEFSNFLLQMLENNNSNFSKEVYGNAQILFDIEFENFKNTTKGKIKKNQAEWIQNNNINILLQNIIFIC